MKDPVGYLHLEGVDGACQIGVDQLRLVDESFKIGLYRLVDVGQVLFDSPDQILGAQIRGGDDGDGGLQFLIEMLLVAGGGASQVSNGGKGKSNAQNRHHIHIIDEQRQYGTHRK